MSRVAYSVLHTRHRIWLPVLAAALLAAGTFGTAFAQEDPLSEVYITFDPDRSTLTVGDLVTLKLEVTYPEDYNSGRARAYLRAWGPFEIREQTPAKTGLQRRRNQDDSPAASRLRRIRPRRTFDTPDLPISVRDSRREGRAGIALSGGVEGTPGIDRPRRSFGGHPAAGRYLPADLGEPAAVKPRPS